MEEDKKSETEFYRYVNTFAKANGISVTEVLQMDKLVEDLRNLYSTKKDKEKDQNKDSDKI